MDFLDAILIFSFICLSLALITAVLVDIDDD